MRWDPEELYFVMLVAQFLEVSFDLFDQRFVGLRGSPSGREVDCRLVVYKDLDVFRLWGVL